MNGGEPERRRLVDAADLRKELFKSLKEGLLRSGGREPIFERADCHIVGEFKLRGANLDCLLRFRNCTFEVAPDVREARLLGLAFVDCTLPGLKARNLLCTHDLLLYRSEVNLEPAPPEEPETSVALTSWKEPGKPEAAVVLTDAVVKGSVVLSRSRIGAEKRRAIQADRLWVSGALLAYRLQTTGEVRLPGATTGGNVNFSGAHLRNLHGFALSATGARIGGSLLCKTDYGRRDRNEEPSEFEADGALYVTGIRIDGSFVLRGAQLYVRPGEKIAVGAWSRAKESSDPSVDPWPALVADGMHVGGNLAFGHGFTADGTMRIINSTVVGSLRMAEAGLLVEPRAKYPHYDRALHLDGTEIKGDVQASRLIASGQLRLCDVAIGGNLLADNVVLKHAGRDVFVARRSRISGNFEMVDGKVDGTLQLASMQVGGGIDLSGTSASAPASRANRSYSVDLRVVQVGRDILLANHGEAKFTAHGGVNLEGARCSRRISLARAHLGSVLPELPEDGDREETGKGIALNMNGVIADEFILTPSWKPKGKVLLARAHCAELDDNDELWQAEGKLELEDFKYDSLRVPIDLRKDELVSRRIEWLRDAMPSYRPGPYDQLAAMLRASGNDEHAATVLLRKHEDRYRALSRGAGAFRPLVWLWSLLQRAVVGYGYRPTRALICLTLLVLFGSLYFGLKPDDCVTDPRYAENVVGARCVVNQDDTGLEWNPVLHTVDLLVPIIDFGNKGRWHMGGADKWVATGITAIGWMLASTVAAGVTRSLRRL